MLSVHTTTALEVVVISAQVPVPARSDVPYPDRARQEQQGCAELDTHPEGLVAIGARVRGPGAVCRTPPGRPPPLPILDVKMRERRETCAFARSSPGRGTADGRRPDLRSSRT